MVDGFRNKLVNVVSGVSQSSVSGPLLFLLYTSELFFILENRLIGHADDSTLMAAVPSQLKIKAVATVDCGNIMCCYVGAIRHRHG